jgi:hypothetical protein
VGFEPSTSCYDRGIRKVDDDGAWCPHFSIFTENDLYKLTITSHYIAFDRLILSYFNNFVTMSAWGAGGSFKSCDALLQRVERNDPTLTNLVILPQKTFGAAEADRLAAVFEKEGGNTHLVGLHASGHAVPALSLKRLGQAIAANKSRIVELAIGNSTMGDEGICAFCEGLATSTENSLESIDFSYKGMGPVGFQAIIRCLGNSQKLRELNLARNEGIGNAATVADFMKREDETSPFFPRINNLDLADCGIDGEFAAIFFPTLFTEGRKLTLRLSGNPIGDEGFRSVLNGHEHLENLYLASCGIDDASMEWLASLKATSTPLTLLDLSNNKISTPGALSLSECLHGDAGNAESACLAQLLDLNLAGNPLGEGGVIALTTRAQQKIPVLKSLDLTETKCGVAGAVAAVRYSHAASLRLFNNNLGPEGFRALEETLRGGHPTLVSLDLAGNRADEASVVALLSALIIPDTSFESKLRTLIVGGNKGGSDVEAMVKRVKEVRPEIDIARDKIAKQNAE